MSISNGTPTVETLGLVPINIISEYGVTLYSRWHRRQTGSTLVIVRRTSDGVDMCTNLVVLDLNSERDADVHPKDFIRWITEGKIVKIYKDR